MNVHAEIARRSETLADKLAANNSLSNTILALLSRLLVMANNKGLPIEGIELSPLATQMSAHEFLLTSHITFNRIALPMTRLWKPSGDFEVFTAARANGLALALSKNPRLSKFFQALCEKIEGYARYHRLPFTALEIQNPFISKDNVLVIGVGKGS